MLDDTNAKTLLGIAENADTPPNARVSACNLLYKLGITSSEHLLEILQQVIQDHRTKSGIQVKALELIDRVNQSSDMEPELSEDEETVKTKLLEKYLECPQQT